MTNSTTGTSGRMSQELNNTIRANMRLENELERQETEKGGSGLGKVSRKSTFLRAKSDHNPHTQMTRMSSGPFLLVLVQQGLSVCTTKSLARGTIDFSLDLLGLGRQTQCPAETGGV